MNTNPRGYLVTTEGWYVRLAFALLCATVSAFIIPLLILILGPFWGFTIGLDIWIVAVTQGFPYFFVAVPEATAAMLIAQLFKRPTEGDTFANYLIILTGLHPRFPWEKITSYIDLRQVNVPFEEDIPAQNGVLTHFRASVTYQPLPMWIPVYIQVSKATIDSVLKDASTSYLTAAMRDEPTPETARQNASRIEQGLHEHLDHVKRAESYERRLGLDVVLTRVADVGFTAQYTKAVNDRAIAETIQQVADGLIARGINPKDAMNFAYINADKIQKQITEFEGARDIADILGRAIQEGFRTIAATRS